MLEYAENRISFGEALKELVELEYAAVDAYVMAIDRLDDLGYKAKIKEFQRETERRIKELSGVLYRNNEDPPRGPNLNKELINKGKFILAYMVGDRTILRAIRSNEEDTTNYYERLNYRDDVWEEVRDILNRGLQEEMKHTDWLTHTLLAK